MVLAKAECAAGEREHSCVYEARYALLYLTGSGDSCAFSVDADDPQVLEAGGKDTLASLRHRQTGQTLGGLDCTAAPLPADPSERHFGRPAWLLLVADVQSGNTPTCCPPARSRA